MSIYKLFIILGLIATDFFTFNALAFNRRFLNFYKGLTNTNFVSSRYLDTHNKQNLGITQFREILIQDNLRIDTKLSNIINEEIEEEELVEVVENKEDRFSLDILSDVNYEENGVFYAEGNVVLTMSNGILKTDKFSYDRANKIIRAEGNINFTKGNQFFEAAFLEYDFIKQIGFVNDIYGVMNFEKINHDLNLFIDQDTKDLCTLEEVDLINLPTEVGLLNSSNIRFKNALGLNAVQFDFSQITKWRFNSDRIELKDNKLSAELIIFTNDPYNEPQFLVTSKGFQAEIIDGKSLFKSDSTFINFDNKITIPIGRRTISDSNPVRWGFGYETESRDGLYLMRNFDPIFTNLYSIDFQPYFLLQRSIEGKTNAFRAVDSSVTSANLENNISFLDSFALDVIIQSNNWKSEKGNESYLNIQSSFKTLNPDKLYDSFSVKANFLRNLFSRTNSDNELLEESCDIEDIKLDLFTSYKSDLGVYGTFDQDNIYSAYGLKLINEHYHRNNQFSRTYSIIFDIGDFQGDSRTDSNQLLSLSRYGFSSSFVHNYKIFNLENTEYGENYIYTPIIIDQGISITASISTGFNYYSNSSSQSILQASIGPTIVYGNLKDKFLDYTYLSIHPEYSYKRGYSPFSFDDFNNDSRLRMTFKQQLFGPIILGFEANMNLNNSSNNYGILENQQYSIGLSRRAYKIDLIYNVDEEFVLFSFNIFNFGYENFSAEF